MTRTALGTVLVATLLAACAEDGQVKAARSEPGGASVDSGASSAAAGPTVSFIAPSDGQLVSGDLSQTEGCEVTGSGIARVEFFLDGSLLNTELEAPWRCNLDSTQFADGTHALRAVAYAADEASSSAQVSIAIQNQTGSSGIDPVDILHQAQADVPFAEHTGYSAQVLGTYPSCTSIPEYPDGIVGSLLPNGETLRMGKVLDPTNEARKAFLFQLAPSDPSTSGSKRCEFSFSKNVGLNKVYWVALSVYVYDWGSLGSGDKSLFGMQLHSGDNSLGLSPSVSINTAGSTNTHFEIQGRYQTNLASSPSQSNTTTVRSEQLEIAFDQWMDFVLQFKLDIGGNGFLTAWYNGVEIWSYQGRLGFETPGFEDYVKFGYYNWSSSFSSPRKILLRSPMLVLDPSGNKYDAADMRAYVQMH